MERAERGLSCPGTVVVRASPRRLLHNWNTAITEQSLHPPGTVVVVHSAYPVLQVVTADYTQSTYTKYGGDAPQ